MTDLKLNEFHDLYVSASGEVALETVFKNDVRQRLEIKLELFLGEWFLNTRLGFPYYRHILVKNPNLSLIRTLFRSAILDDPDVVAVPQLTLDHDTAARRLYVRFDAVLRDGSLVSVSLPAGLADNIVTTTLGDPVVTGDGGYIIV